MQQSHKNFIIKVMRYLLFICIMIISGIIFSCSTAYVLEENACEYVDLGLPSGTLWCTHNVGATIPSDVGEYFAWGESASKESYCWDTYAFYEYNPTLRYNIDDIVVMTKYNVNGYPDELNLSFHDKKSVLDKSDDVAYVRSHGVGEIPTCKQWLELFKECHQAYEEVNGVSGARFEGKNGKCIFIPYGRNKINDKLQELKPDDKWGTYWCSELYTDTLYRSCRAFRAAINNNGLGRVWIDFRYFGMPIRPVKAGKTN